MKDTEYRHPEETCQRCGNRNVRAWYAESELWNSVTEGAGLDRNVIWCPQCFTEEYEHQHDLPPSWRLELETEA